MNGDRRKRLALAHGLLTTITAAYDEAKSILVDCATEEANYFAEMPEGLQASERGQKAEEVADALNEIVEQMEEFDISKLLDSITTARE